MTRVSYQLLPVLATDERSPARKGMEIPEFAETLGSESPLILSSPGETSIPRSFSFFLVASPPARFLPFTFRIP